MIARLLQRLNRVFNKDLGRQPIVAISCDAQPAMANIADGRLVLTAGGVFPVEVSLEGMTLAELVAAVNDGSVFTAAIINHEDNFLLATGLMEGSFDLSNDQNIYYPNSLLNKELQTYARELSQEEDQLRLALRQLYANSAEGDWLDLWMRDYFGIARYDGESDMSYFTRAAAEVFGLKVNNKAIMGLLKKALGYNVDVKDLGAPLGGCFYCNAADSVMNGTGGKDKLIADTSDVLGTGLIGIYLHSGSINNLLSSEKNAIVAIVNSCKAAGKRALYFAPTNQLISNDIATPINDAGFTVGPRNSGWTEVYI